MKKMKINSYRLRMVFGKWYIIKYADDGATEIEREGPIEWSNANQKCSKLREKGLVDLDRLNDTEIR